MSCEVEKTEILRRIFETMGVKLMDLLNKRPSRCKLDILPSADADRRLAPREGDNMNKEN